MMNFCTTNSHPLPQQNQQEPAGNSNIAKAQEIEILAYNCNIMLRY
jgi:hypothetical protein